MSDAVMSMDLLVNAKTGVARAEIKGLSNDVRGVGANIKAAAAQTRQGFASMAQGVMVATAAIGGAIAIGSELVRAAQVQQKAEMELEAALRLTGNTAGDAADRWKSLASDIQTVTTVGDETTLGLMQLALSMGATEDNLEQVTVGAIGLSKAFKIDLNTATKMTTLGMSGQYTMLSRYIPELRTAKNESEKAAIFQRKLAEGFSLARAEAETSAGKMEQLSNNFGDLKEKLGDLLLPILDKAVEGLSSITTTVQGLINGIKKLNAKDMLDSTVGFFRSIAEYSTLGLSEMALGAVGLGKETEKATQKQKEFKTEIDKTTAAIFRNEDMIRAEISEMENLKSGAKSMKEMEFAKKRIEELTEELDKLIGKTKSSKRSFKDANEAMKTQSAVAELAATAESDFREQVALQIKVLNENEAAQRKLNQSKIEAILLKDAETEASRRLAEETEETKLAEQWKAIEDSQKAHWDKMRATAESGALAVAESIGAMLNAEDTKEAGKNLAKTVGNVLIDIAESFVLAAAAASAGKAITSFGATLITDAPWLAAAYGGLEVLRGFVNSFRTGINFVPNDQIAMLHQGEKVQSASEVNSERPHERRRYMREPVHVTQFKTVVDSYYANQGRRVR